MTVTDTKEDIRGADIAGIEEVSDEKIEEDFNELVKEYDNSDDENLNSLNLYFKEIAAYPLLSREQEAELAKRIETGDKEALDELTNANLRLVVSTAKKYSHTPEALLDNIQNGNEGLMKAAKKFDYREGYKFSTYAVWWITQGIFRGIENQARTIRLPTHIEIKLRSMKKKESEFMREHGRAPETEELAQMMGLSTAVVRRLKELKPETVSLNTKITNGDEESDTEMGDLIPDKAPGTEETAMQTILGEKINEILDECTERERTILCMRFGLNGYGRYTLNEIGEMYGVTRERIRQIELKTLRRFKSPKNKRLLHDFYEE